MRKRANSRTESAKVRNRRLCKKSLKLNVLKLTESIKKLRSKLVEEEEALDIHTTEEQLKFQCRNIIHGSDGPETAKDEIKLWFKPKELVIYTHNAEKWIYGEN